MKKLLILLTLFVTSVWAKHVDVTVQYLNYKNIPYLAVILKNNDNWHTYWKNPGDAGTPNSFKFFLNDQPVEFEALEWPTPVRFIENGDLWGYGYKGIQAYFFKLTEPQLADGNILRTQVKWLACDSICVPGEEELIGRFEGDEFLLFNRKDLQVEDDQLIFWLEKIPKKVSFPINLDLVLSKEKNRDHLWLQVNLDGHKEIPTNKNLLYPLPNPLLTYYHEKLFRDRKGNIYGRYRVDWEGEYAEPAIALPENGRLKIPLTLKFLFNNPETGKTELIEKSIDLIHMRGVDQIENFFRFLSPIEVTHEEEAEEAMPTSAETSGTSFFYFLILAFLGGIILNFMPCVLPVISLKLFGLLQSKELSRAALLKHNLAYTFGVLATFLIMSLVIVMVKTTGINLGWGFQLQSPTFILIMVAIIFIFALNLFGLFEFGTPGGKVLGEVKLKENVWGDFSSGILATILATPCSAPFLGTALAFALSNSTTEIIITFMVIGLGLAFPFLLTAFIPGLISFLPKPGNWMNTLKYFLGLTLILTTIWLIDIYYSLLGNFSSIIKINILLTLVFFSIFLIKKVLQKPLSKIVFTLIPIAMFAFMIAGHYQSQESNSTLDLQWEKWSVAQMEGFKQTRNIVFMDFTANWCLTCKVNKKLVLDTEEFKNLIVDKQVKLLRGDITKRDEIIESWLKKQGMGGVPAYFIQTSTGELIKLGETISIDEIEKNLR